MSTYGERIRTLPFFTLHIEQHYSDENGYDGNWEIKAETLLGTFTVNEYDFKYAPRNFWRCLTKKSYGGWKYFRPIQYERPCLTPITTGSAENIRYQIVRNKRLEHEHATFQKLTPEQKEQHIAYHKNQSLLEARQSYARILDDIGRKDDSIIVAQGGSVDGVGPKEIQDLADNEHQHYVKWITGDKA